MRLTIPFAALPLLTACAGIPTLTTLHDPLYRAQAHVSTITATAREAQDGISEIRIDSVQGDLTACTGRYPSLVPCRANAFAQSAVCTFAAVKTPASCSLAVQPADRRLISYTSSTRNAKGRTASTTAITYAAGAPLTQARVDLLITSLTIPWETARPVWWHTDAPGGASPADKIDVGFYPDADFGSDYRAFTDGLQTIALGSFFTDANPFSELYRFWKFNFNLWAGPAGADGEGCTRNFAGAAATVAAATDGDAILHRNAFRDCAAIALGGAGTVQTTADDAAWLFVHEGGHFLHGLGDEYVGGGNASISDPNNVFASQSACQSGSTAEGFPTGQCVQIGVTGTWRNDDGQLTTMEERTLASDWRTLSGRAVGRRLMACGNGNCY